VAGGTDVEDPRRRGLPVLELDEGRLAAEQTPANRLEQQNLHFAHGVRVADRVGDLRLRWVRVWFAAAKGKGAAGWGRCDAREVRGVAPLPGAVGKETGADG
jgi:hypothetical protein